MGTGLNDPSYQDVVIPDGAPNPEDFNDGMLLTDQTHKLGLGQINAPTGVVYDLEHDASNELEEIMMEEAFQGSVAAVDGFVFIGDIQPVR